MTHLNAIAFSLDIALLLAHHTPKHVLSYKDFDPDSPDVSVGAGSIISSSRIAINILPQTVADMNTQGRNDDYFSTRIAKNNHGPKGMVTWWTRRILRASNGQGYPTPVTINIKDAMKAINASYIAMIGDHMLTYGANALGVTQAAIVVVDGSPFNDRTIKSMAETLRLLFNRGNITHQYTAPDGRRFTMVLDIDSKTHQFTLVEIAGLGPSPAMSLVPNGGMT